MRILVLDRCENQSLRENYEEFLEMEGHKVFGGSLILDIPEYGNGENSREFLASLDAAVVHPHWSCAAELIGELERREEFKVVCYKVPFGSTPSMVEDSSMSII